MSTEGLLSISAILKAGIGRVDSVSDRGVSGIVVRSTLTAASLVVFVNWELGALTDDGVDPINLVKEKSYSGRDGSPDRAKALNDGGPVFLRIKETKSGDDGLSDRMSAESVVECTLCIAHAKHYHAVGAVGGR